MILMKRRSRTGLVDKSHDSPFVNTSVSVSAEPSKPSRAKKPRPVLTLTAGDDPDPRLRASDASSGDSLHHRLPASVPDIHNNLDSRLEALDHEINKNFDLRLRSLNSGMKNISDPHPRPSHQVIAPIPPIITQRAAKAAKIAGEVGSNNGAKGRVRVSGVGLEYFKKATRTWIPAAYHNDLRAQLIQEAANQGEYDQVRKRGEGPHDETSFLLSQKSWGEDRQFWPDILFQIEFVRDKSLPKHIPLWYRNGQIVLDHDNHPVRVFSTLPDTCSSELEGWQLVAMFHSDHRIQIADIRARMPKYRILNGESLPLFTTNAISMRMSRFRTKVGIDAREERAGSKDKKAVTKSMLPIECLEGNSVKTFSRLLTAEEQKTIEEKNKGKFPQKARVEKRASATEVSQSAKRSRKRKKSNKAHKEGESAKRSCIPTQMGQVETSQGPVLLVQSPVLGIRVDSFVDDHTPKSCTTAQGLIEQHSTNMSVYDHVYKSFAPTEHYGFRKDDRAGLKFNATQPSAYWSDHRHHSHQGVSGYYPESVLAERNIRYPPGTSTGRPHNGFHDRVEYTSAPFFELPQAEAKWTQTRGERFRTSSEYMIMPSFAQVRDEFAESTAVQGGHDQAMSEYSLTPGFEPPENNLAESTKVQGVSSRVAFDNALGSNVGQPSTARVGSVVTYTPGSQFASNDLSTRGMESINLGAAQDLSETQPLLDTLSEPEHGITYPKLEAINHGPYGTIPKGYSLLSSNQVREDLWQGASDSV